MVKNTNAVFLIICGAIFVTSVYLIIHEGFPDILQNIFTDNKEIVESADNGATPEVAEYISDTSTDTTFEVKYKKAKNATRYQCRYGEEKGELNRSGIIYIAKDDIACQVQGVESGTKYYVELISVNNNKKTSSPLRTVTTK